MKSQKRRKKSRAEEETDPKMAGHWKQGSFSIQLAVMPLLAGSYICSQQFLVVLSKVSGQKSINRMPMVTKPLLYATKLHVHSHLSKVGLSISLYRRGMEARELNALSKITNKEV